MADPGSSRARHDYLPDEPVFGDEYWPQRDTRRESNSTLGSRSRRESYYDTQRINRRSRPPSVASQATTKSKGKRASHPGDKRASYPGNIDNVDEVAAPPPVPAQDYSPHLEDERYREPSVRNFSQPYPRGRPSGSNTRDQGISELSALPPVPKSQRSSAPIMANRESIARAGQQEESDDEPRPYSSRRPDELLRPPAPAPRWLAELYTISYLIFFSILGTLARLAVQWITFYPGAPITTPVVWANMAGSFLLGFLSEDQGLFRHSTQQAALAEKNQDVTMQPIDKAEHAKHKKTIPLYIGLAVGFCGSFTSFSSFSRDFFLALSNNLPAPVYHTYASPSGTVTPSTTLSRNGGYSFEAILAVVIYTICLSLGALIFGAHMAIFLEKTTRPIPINFTRKFLDPAMIFLGWGCWLGAVFLSIWPPDRPGGPSSRGSWANETWRGEVIFALVFAPLGCLLRFYASLKLNGLVASFPLGTFAVNMFGTAVEGMCYDIQHVRIGYMGRVGGGLVGCQILQGVQDGFCGCLTTVSTWVSEINGLKRKHGYAYAFASVVGGLCLMVVIMGSVRWSVGFEEPVCSTGYPSKVHG